MNYFEGVTTAAQARQRFRDLAMKHHPDKGGSAEVMKEINQQYDELLKHGFLHYEDVFQQAYRRNERQWKQDPPKEPNKDFWDKRVRELTLQLERLQFDYSQLEFQLQQQSRYYHRSRETLEDLQTLHESLQKRELDLLRRGMYSATATLIFGVTSLFTPLIGGIAGATTLFLCITSILVHQITEKELYWIGKALQKIPTKL